MGVTSVGRLDLATFDGDVTLYVSLAMQVCQADVTSSYDDGMSLEPKNPVIDRIIRKCISIAVWISC